MHTVEKIISEEDYNYISSLSAEERAKAIRSMIPKDVLKNLYSCGIKQRARGDLVIWYRWEENK